MDPGGRQIRLTWTPRRNLPAERDSPWSTEVQNFVNNETVGVTCRQELLARMPGTRKKLWRKARLSRGASLPVPCLSLPVLCPSLSMFCPLLPVLCPSLPAPCPLVYVVRVAGYRGVPARFFPPENCLVQLEVLRNNRPEPGCPPMRTVQFGHLVYVK